MAVNEAEILSGLNIGVDRPDPVGDAVVIAIQSVTKAAVQRARDLLLKKGTGSLAQSIIALPVRQNGDVYEFQIVADDYALYVDKGVDGISQSHGSPYKFVHPRPGRAHADAIRRWIPAAGIKANAGQSYESLSWAIATAIKQKGLKPYPFISKSFGDPYEKEMAEALEIAIGRAVEIKMNPLEKKK